MKNIFSEDPAAIEKEMDSLVKNKTELICGGRGTGNIKKFTVVGKTIIENTHFIILSQQDGPTPSSGPYLFYYHSKVNCLRVFECTTVKKVHEFVCFEYPKQICNIYQRAAGRVTTPSNSVITFFVEKKHRIFNGSVRDISLKGAKLQVDIPGYLAKGALLYHIALTIRYHLSEIQTVINIPEAEVAWSDCAHDVTNTLGIKFTLPQHDHVALSNYIDIRSIEEETCKAGRA